MTHPRHGYFKDPRLQRVGFELDRLSYLIDQLKYYQLVMPDLADQFQERIDKYQMQYDALEHNLTR
jgi:hypothetical protein